MYILDAFTGVETRRETGFWKIKHSTKNFLSVMRKREVWLEVEHLLMFKICDEKHVQFQSDLEV